MQKRGGFVKKIIKFLCVIVVILLLTTVASARNGIGWYCVRGKNHMQPKLDSTLSVIDDYDVYWIDKHYNDDNKEKVIYLTFDAGYENGNVEKILDVLKKENVQAGFFVLENILLKNPDLIKRMINEGHTIANHTATHRDTSKIRSKEEFCNEIRRLETVFEENYSMPMAKFFRPPEGKFSTDNLVWAKEMGYKTVMWSFAYADWDNGRQISSEKAKEIILKNIHNGEVMLLHPTSETNALILEDIILELKNQGFKFGTLEELCLNEA